MVEGPTGMIKIFRRRAGQHRAAPDPTVRIVYVPLPAAGLPPGPPVQHLTCPPADPWIWDSATIVTSANAFWARMEQHR